MGVVDVGNSSDVQPSFAERVNGTSNVTSA